MKTSFFVLLFFMCTTLSAQIRTISGTVKDNRGPLLGTSVIVKGTNTGTQTNFDGRYTIEASPDDILVFSYIGYDTKEVKVENKTIIDVVLDANSLEEVVIVAQAVKREKKAVGYSVMTISGHQLNGRASGVRISNNRKTPEFDQSTPKCYKKC